MALSRKKEDYLKQIYTLQFCNNRAIKLSEIASALNISRPSASEMIKKLKKENFVEIREKRGITLTKQGVKEARKVLRKHQLLEVFFVKLLKISQKHRFHREAHKMEHELSEDASDKLDWLLNKPKICPDGNPIPNKKSQIIGLDKVPINKPVRVLFARTRNTHDLTRLNALGIVPSAEIRVLKKISNGPVILLIKGSQIALGSEICSKIFVETK